ncbi:hypothetical protein BH09PSE3_BH09PSE3_16320 [soil metagenome]
MRRSIVQIAMPFLIASCSDKPAHNTQSTAKPQPTLAQGHARATATDRKYRQVRRDLRNADAPKNYPTLIHQQYILELEMKRMDPLSGEFAMRRENALDARATAEDAIRQADMILNTN